jgi:autophagy-related protein 11
VALTPQGRSVKIQTVHQEVSRCYRFPGHSLTILKKEIYIYDIRITQATSPGSAPSHASESPLPKRYNPPMAPNLIEDARAIISWQNLYKERRTWATKVAEECGHLAQATQDRYSEMDVIIKCLDAAITNLEHSVKQIEPKYNDLEKWVKPALAEHEQLAKNWEHSLSLAKSVPISAAMVKFMTKREVKKPKNASLEDLIELDTARKSGRLAPTSLKKFSTKAADLEKAAGRMYQELEALSQDFDQLMNRSVLTHGGEAFQLLDDLEAVAKKIDTDYQTTMEYTDSHRDHLQASRTAQNHTDRLLPSLRKRAKEMDEMLQYATKGRNTIAADSVDFMRAITQITALHSSVKTQINVLNSAEDDLNTFDYLRLIHQLPYMYASFAAEAIRRREWAEKVKTDSSTLANEMALFQDEETKRRRKWQKMVGSMYGPDAVEPNAMGLEVNLRGEEEVWPSLTKQDLEEFLEHLQQQRADTTVIEDVSKLLIDLNNPTKQQSKRLKAFKNGSVHEAALGRSGLMIRGDDEVIRNLQEQNARLETKLKTSESRVRRLEDVLHRQSQASRPSLGNVFQPGSHNDSIISTKDDRRRSGEGTEAFLQRIKQLELDLGVEKEKSAIFEKDLTVRTNQHNDIKGQMEEVNSTKKDLLENMEALKREWDEERKSLEDEIKNLKAQIEDTEDEIVHFGESRENEKANYDEKVHDLERQIDRLQKDRNDDTLRTQGQVDFLRTEGRLQRERIDMLDNQLQTAQEEAKSLAKTLETTRETGYRQLLALKDLHIQLAPNEKVPDDLADLVETLDTKTTDLLAKTQTAENDMILLKSDLELAHANIKELRQHVASAKESLAEEEVTTLHLRENLAEETAKVTALEGELGVAREQLDQLRTKIADGETGSETLRKKLDEEEKKIMKLAEDLASKQSQVGSIEEELRLFKEKLLESHAKLSGLTALFDARTSHAKDLTQRLYSQNDRLCRLLERVGFSVARQGSKMTIIKVSRADRSSQNANDSSDPGSSVRRSATLTSRPLADSTDLELLHWMNAVDVDAESEKYEAFMTALGTFDMDLFSETVYRRLKDVEHLARKFQRESRAYREKAHALQKEAHEKIAYKHFKEGDLALFLPTRNQSAGAWAAFNIGFPHYFLREQDAHRLRSREWLLARIGKIQERVVDLSKSIHQPSETDSMNDEDNDNPFQLSDGLRWYLLDAHEDKAGAPATPGLGKSTVATNNVDAVADLHTHARIGKDKHRAAATSIEGVSKTLSKSLESRRSSTGSRKALPFSIAGGKLHLNSSALASETNSPRAVAPETPHGTSPTHGNALAAPNNVSPTPAQGGSAQTRGEPSNQTPNSVPTGDTPAPELGQQLATGAAVAEALAEAMETDGPKTPEVRNNPIDSLLGP